jgi:hypothetical protein
MKKRRVMLLLAGLLVVLVVVFVWLREREPVYQGRKLSEWVLRAYQFNGPQQREAASAVRQIGGKAVPWLLMWTDVRDDIPSWKLRLLKWTKRFPRIQQTDSFWRIMRIGNKPLEVVVASFHGFEVLGPEARGAIPALRKRLNGPSRGGSDGAVRALSFIGKEALPLLLVALDDMTRSNRPLIARSIGHMRNLGDEANKAVPVIIRCIAGNDKQVAGAAIGALGELKAAPEVVLPALRKTLHGTDAQLRAFAMRAIGEYGERARETIPDLWEATNSGDWSIRNEATNTLKKIQGEPMLELKNLK